MTAALDFMSVGGWKRSIDIVFSQFLLIAGMIQRGNIVSFGKHEESIGFRDFLDPVLLLGFPVAVCRYVLRAPKLTFSAVAVMALTAALPDNFESNDFIFVIAVGLQLLIALWMVRVVFTALLQDRDSVLADSIREAC